MVTYSCPGYVCDVWWGQTGYLEYSLTMPSPMYEATPPTSPLSVPSYVYEATQPTSLCALIYVWSYTSDISVCPHLCMKLHNWHLSVPSSMYEATQPTSLCTLIYVWSYTTNISVPSPMYEATQPTYPLSVPPTCPPSGEMGTYQKWEITRISDYDVTCKAS